MNLKNTPIVPIATAGIFIFATYKILQKFGLIKTEAEEKEEQSIEKSESISDIVNVFSPTSKIPGGSVVLTPDAARKYAKFIYDSAHWYGDDEERIYNAFRQMKTQSMVTSIAIAFNKVYGKDLYYWLKSVLSKSELATVLKIVNSKPKYKVK